MWDLIVSVPDHCLSFYFVNQDIRYRKIRCDCVHRSFTHFRDRWTHFLSNLGTYHYPLCLQERAIEIGFLETTSESNQNEMISSYVLINAAKKLL